MASPTVTGKNRLVYDVYSGNSIERCDALWADIADQRGFMSQKAVETMDNFVLGHRMREWKPTSSHAPATPSSYCYMYYDQKHGVVDPALQGQTCDATNPMFQKDVVKRVFVDNNRDHSHVLPYAKCVVEVDTDKTRGAQSTSNLDAFWKDFGKTQCEEVYKQYMQSYDVRKSVLASCNTELSEYRRLVPLYEAQQAKYQQANATHVQLQTMFARSNCAFFGGDACTSSSSSSAVGSLTLQINQHTTLTTSLQRLTKSNALVMGELTQLLQANNQYISDNDTFESRIVQATSNIYACCNIQLPPARAALDAAYQNHAQLVNDIASLDKRLALCLSSCNVLVPKLDALENENENYDSMIAKATHAYQICEQKTSYLADKVDAASKELKITLSKLKICKSNEDSLKAQKSMLYEKYKELGAELDTWVRKCKEQQDVLYTDASMRLATINSTALADAKNNCGNPVAEMDSLQELFRLKNDANKRLSDARMLPSSVPILCDDPDVQLQIQKDCCKIPDPRAIPRYR